MNPHYNQNYTRQEIDLILSEIKSDIANNRFSISANSNRQENVDFIQEYNIRSNHIKRILLGIQTDDFCHSLQNNRLGFEHETLYVFVPQVVLYNAHGTEELVDIYTKFNIIQKSSGSRTIVISFHRRNKPIDYLFR